MARWTTPGRWRRRWLGIGAGMALVAAPAAAQPPQLGGTTPDTATGEVIERIIVKVNGDIITTSEVEQRQVDVLRRRGAQPTTDADLIRVLDEITPEVISAAVDELLMMQRGRELGYTMTDEQFEQIVEELRAENDLTTEEEFEQALATEGITRDDLRRTFERQMLISQVQQVEVLGKVTLTQVEAREYYDENIEQFTEPATVTMREILIRAPEPVSGNISVAADDQARLDAEEARQRVLAGEDFARVAVAVSDAASKANGGLIGPLDLGVVSPALAEVLAGLEVGEISEPIRTPVGYQVLRLEAQTSPEPRPFEEVHDAIANNVFSDRRQAEYTKYLDELRAGADIEWKFLRYKEYYDRYRETRASRLGASGG